MLWNHPATSNKRRGFTLIEILVVIAIIAILASLLLGAVMMVRGRGPELQTRNDIMQISTGLQKFHSTHSFYPPDRIILFANASQYNPAPAPPAATKQFYDQSLATLRAMWPNLQANFTGMAWAGPTAMPAAGFVLEGDQCLVFFLGGIPDANGKPTGFSTNPTNPTAAGGDRKDFIKFDAGRIELTYHSGSPFGAFTDPYRKKPYVYFSSYKRDNGYAPAGWWSLTPNTHAVLPYVKTAGAAPVFWDSSKFQIVSAGPDGIFGPGGLWPSTPVPTAAMDDYTSFHDRKLGSP